MKMPSRFPRFGLLAAASLAFCFQAPLRAEEKPAAQAKGKKLTVEDNEQLNKATAALSEARILFEERRYAEALQVVQRSLAKVPADAELYKLAALSAIRMERAPTIAA